MSTKPRWGVGLTGQDIDLLLWLESLKLPFDPWVERVEDLRSETHVLYSRRFDGEANYEGVMNLASGLVRELNGAMALARSAHPVKVNSILDFSQPVPSRHVSIKAEGVVMRVYASSPTLTVYDAEGHVIPPPPPVPSPPQAWISQTRLDDIVGDVLVHASRADNWYDVYKLIEASSEYVGGINRLEMLSPGIKEAKRSANVFRHHRVDSPPSPLLDFHTVQGRAYAAAKAALGRGGR